MLLILQFEYFFLRFLRTLCMERCKFCSKTFSITFLKWCPIMKIKNLLAGEGCIPWPNGRMNQKISIKHCYLRYNKLLKKKKKRKKEKIEGFRQCKFIGSCHNWHFSKKVLHDELVANLLTVAFCKSLFRYRWLLKTKNLLLKIL